MNVVIRSNVKVVVLITEMNVLRVSTSNRKSDLQKYVIKYLDSLKIEITQNITV